MSIGLREPKNPHGVHVEDSGQLAVVGVKRRYHKCEFWLPNHGVAALDGYFRCKGDLLDGSELDVDCRLIDPTYARDLVPAFFSTALVYADCVYQEFSAAVFSPEMPEDQF
jgi:hypothetical protein